MEASDIYTRLSIVRKFTVNTRPGNDLSGAGTVEVETASHGNIIWREQGRWDQSLHKLEFTNVYRWTKNSKSKLMLEHLRYGENNPVSLVHLQKLNQNQWSSTAPHKCGADEYFLNLYVSLDRLTMIWRITGPNKNLTSTLCYT